jgi:D-amino peptidase
MRYFISVDMEGISGLVDWNDPKEKINQYMTREVSAVINGIKKKDPSAYILVCDAHDNGQNLNILGLPEDVHLIQGPTRTFYMVQGYEEQFDAAIFIGYHAPVGTWKGLMDHSYSSSAFFEVKINGDPVGEAEINAVLLSEAGIPVILMSGDNEFKQFSSQRFPKTSFVVTKYSIGKFCAELVHPALVHRELEEEVQKAIGRIAEISLYAPKPPLYVEVTLVNTLMTDIAATLPGVERLDGRKLTFTASNGKEMYRYIMSLLYLCVASKVK